MADPNAQEGPQQPRGATNGGAEAPEDTPKPDRGSEGPNQRPLMCPRFDASGTLTVRTVGEDAA